MPVHADDGQRRGGGQHGRDGAGVALRLVHADVGQLVIGQELQRLLAVVLAHPGLVAELDADLARRDPLGDEEDVLLAGAPDHEPLRELEQDRAEPPGLPQRLQRGQETLPGLVGDRGVDVLEVDVGLAAGRLLHRRPQVLGQRGHPRGVLGEQAERLDVEGETLRGPVRPRGRGLLRGQRVVGGVHFHQRELAGVVAEAFFGVVRLGRVPARLDQGLVRPRRRPDPDISHNSSLSAARWRAAATGSVRLGSLGPARRQRTWSPAPDG